MIVYHMDLAPIRIMAVVANHEYPGRQGRFGKWHNLNCDSNRLGPKMKKGSIP